MSSNKTPPDPDESNEPNNASTEEKYRTRNTKAGRKDLPMELWNKYSNHKDSRTKFPIQIEEIRHWCIKNRTCFVCLKRSCMKEMSSARSQKDYYPVPKEIICSNITRGHDRTILWKSNKNKYFTKAKKSTNKPSEKKRPNNAIKGPKYGIWQPR